MQVKQRHIILILLSFWLCTTAGWTQSRRQRHGASSPERQNSASRGERGRSDAVTAPAEDFPSVLGSAIPSSPSQQGVSQPSEKARAFDGHIEHLDRRGTAESGRSGQSARPAQSGRPIRTDRPNLSNRPILSEISGRTERANTTERPERNPFTGRSDRPQTADRPSTPVAPNASVRPSTPERPERPEGMTRPERTPFTGRPNRPDTSARPDHVNRPDRPNVPNRPNRPDRPGHSDRPDSPGHYDRPSRPDRPGHSDHSGRPQWGAGSNRPHFPERPEVHDRAKHPRDHNRSHYSGRSSFYPYYPSWSYYYTSWPYYYSVWPYYRSGFYDPFWWPRRSDYYFETWTVIDGGGAAPAAPTPSTSTTASEPSEPEILGLELESGDDNTFELSADLVAGYSWSAHYDPRFCEVTITHRPERNIWGQIRTDKPGKAKVKITARSPGQAVIKFIYARRDDLDQGLAPLDSFELYLDVLP